MAENSKSDERYSPERTAQEAKREVLKRRRDLVRGFRSDAGPLEASEARYIWDLIGDEIEEVDARSILPKAMGHEEWWNCMSSEPHPDYQYLCRVIVAAQEGLRAAARQGKGAQL